jgi:hypothetical protein
MELAFDPVEAINVGIATLVSIPIAIITAYAYDYFKSRSEARRLKNKYQYLESKDDKFDWQHWDIINGEIADYPVQSFMKIKYGIEKTLEFYWTNNANGQMMIDSGGLLIMDDLVRGKMNFFEFQSLTYDYRDFVYTTIHHNNVKYEGLIVNAKDQGTKYIMMRPIESK